MAAPLESVISIKSNTLKAASKSSHLLDHTSRPPRYCAASVNRSSHDLDREGAAAGGVHHCVPSVCASQEDLGVLATHGEEGLGVQTDRAMQKHMIMAYYVQSGMFALRSPSIFTTFRRVNSTRKLTQASPSSHVLAPENMFFPCHYSISFGLPLSLSASHHIELSCQRMKLFFQAACLYCEICVGEKDEYCKVVKLLRTSSVHRMDR
ncbi:hypothetical protein GW17_00052236 [Ensete ventricosum]|nr:hypothetical protein GW17_00052236 [Ensete ventricosum]